MERTGKYWDDRAWVIPTSGAGIDWGKGWWQVWRTTWEMADRFLVEEGFRSAGKYIERVYSEADGLTLRCWRQVSELDRLHYQSHFSVLFLGKRCSWLVAQLDAKDVQHKKWRKWYKDSLRKYYRDGEDAWGRRWPLWRNPIKSWQGTITHPNLESTWTSVIRGESVIWYYRNCEGMSQYLDKFRILQFGAPLWPLCHRWQGTCSFCPSAD